MCLLAGDSWAEMERSSSSSDGNERRLNGQEDNNGEMKGAGPSGAVFLRCLSLNPGEEAVKNAAWTRWGHQAAAVGSKCWFESEGCTAHAHTHTTHTQCSQPRPRDALLPLSIFPREP